MIKTRWNVMENDDFYEKVPIYIALAVNTAHCMNI